MKIYEARIQFNLVSEGENVALDTPQKVCEYMTGAFEEDPTVEWFYVISLNRKNIPIGRTVITKGIATAALVHPREVFRPALLAGASALIAVHNHPSGDPSPSVNDIQITRQLKTAAQALQIELLDHVIYGDGIHDSPNQYYSFSNSGIL